MKFCKVFSSVILLCGLWLNTVHAVELGPLDIHGFISQGYMKSSANNFLTETAKGSFEYNEVGVNFTSNVTDNLRVGLQLLSRDLGDSGNNETVLDWGYADYRWRNELGLRLGKIKVATGLYNDGRDLDMLRTNILLPQSVYAEYMRSFWNAIEGGGVYGTISAGALGSIEYVSSIGSTSVQLDNTNIKSALQVFLLKDDDITRAKLTVKYSNANRIIWNTPIEGLRLGLSEAYIRSRNNTEYKQIVAIPSMPGSYMSVYFPYYVDVRFTIQVISGEYKWKDLTLAGEFFTATSNCNYQDPVDPTTGLPLTAMPTIYPKLEGYYGSASYRFADWLEIGGYYSMHYPDVKDKYGNDLVVNSLIKRAMDPANLHYPLPRYAAWQRDSCVTARFDITPSWLVKVEGHHMNGVAQVYDYESAADLKKIWSLYALKTTYSF